MLTKAKLVDPPTRKLVQTLGAHGLEQVRHLDHRGLLWTILEHKKQLAPLYLC